MTDSDLDSRLERLAQATQGLRAGPGFNQRVMLTVNAASLPSWLDAVTRLARGALAVGGLVTLVAIGWAIESDRAVNEASAVAFFSLDLDP